MNKLSDKVSVVQKDIALLERGKEVRYLGINLAMGDIFDAGRQNLCSCEGTRKFLLLRCLTCHFLPYL